jgi:hypothetical protein
MCDGYMKYKLTEVKPRIFFLNFTSNYDMAMMFLRYQEHYESPNPKFRDKAFTILEFMQWYSKKFGKGAFTYPVDWGGFNIPGEVIIKVNILGISDKNVYDQEMKALYDKCYKVYPDGKFYIIAAVGVSGAMKHEIAHGLFYTQPKYRLHMKRLVKALKPTLRKKMFKALGDIGYTSRVYVDECQAYFATGIPDDFNVKTNKAHEPFVKTYENYYESI